MAKPKKVLVWCSKSVFPPSDGGTRAMQGTLTALEALGYSPKVVFLSTWKHPFVGQALPQWLPQKNTFPLAVDTKVSWWMFGRMLAAKHPFQLWRFGRAQVAQTNELRKFLLETSPDLVIWEGLPATWWKKKVSLPDSCLEIYRCHNIEHHVYGAVWEKMSQPLKRLLLKIENKRLERYELALWNQVDTVLTMTDSDASEIKLKVEKTKINVWPVGGFSIQKARAFEPPLRFYHLGAMDWLPNKAGLEWLVREIWPQVIKRYPTAELHLAGKAFPKRLDWENTPGIRCHGEVENSADFASRNHVLVVPVRESSGVRVKILEALSMGKLVVSTPEGAMGLPADLKQSLWIGEKVEDLVRLMSSALEHPEIAFENACIQQNLFAQHYAPQKLGTDLDAILEALQ